MSTALAALPATGDQSTWTASESALVEAAGLVYQDGRNGPKRLAERPTVEAFLLHCRRTGLDPIARQIYAIRRSGKWTTQVSIDGARLVAERTGRYEGQTDPEWSNDGKEWTVAWDATPEHPFPKFARVGVYKQGFREALKVVARWDSYAVYDDVWQSGQKTGEKKVSAMWAKMPDLMLAKVAEMLALRKAFPQDLSGLYSAEEMQQAETPAVAASSAPAAQWAPTTPAAPAAQPEPEVIDAEIVPSRDWAGEARACSSIEQLRALYQEADNAGELGSPVEGPDQVLGRLMRRLRQEFIDREKAAQASPAPARDWAGEARAAETRAQLQSLVEEGAAAGVDNDLLREMAAFEDSLPVEGGTDWDVAASEAPGEATY